MDIHRQHVMKTPFMLLPFAFAVILASFNLEAQPSEESQATEIADTVHKLAGIVPADKELPYDVPEPARPLLTQLKHQLRDLVVNTLNDPAFRTADSTQLTGSVASRLRAAGIEVGGEHQPEYFGGIDGINIVQPKGHPDLRAATTTIGVPCGADTSLYIFKRGIPAWIMILAAESNNYAQVDGAQGDFGFDISPPDENGLWFLITKKVPPWCTSNWSAVRYQVLRPGPATDRPIILLNEEGDYRRYEAESLAVREHDFTLTNFGYQMLDGGILERICFHRYSVIGDRVTRVPPIAVLPQDFIDEWINLPWKEARRWSNPSAIDRLELWHSRLQRGTGEDWEKLHYYSEIEFVQPCNKPPSKWQIGIPLDSEKRQDKLPQELYFTVAKGNGAFSMTDITPTRPLGCPGKASPVNWPDPSLIEKELNQHLNSTPR